MTRFGLLVLLSISLAGGAAHARLSPGDLAIDGELFAQQSPPPPGYYQQPPPPGYYQQPAPYYAPPPPRPLTTRSEPRYALLISGLVIFGVGWFSDMLLTSSFNHEPFWESAVPIAGPLLQMNDNTYANQDNKDFSRFFLIWEFVIQAAGGVMTLCGLVFQHTVTVYADGPQKINLAFTPLPGGGSFSASF